MSGINKANPSFSSSSSLLVVMPLPVAVPPLLELVVVVVVEAAVVTVVPLLAALLPLFLLDLQIVNDKVKRLKSYLQFLIRNFQQPVSVY